MPYGAIMNKRMLEYFKQILRQHATAHSDELQRAVIELGGFYQGTSDARIAAQLAAVVKDEAHRNDERLNAYLSLLEVIGTPIEEFPKISDDKDLTIINWRIVSAWPEAK